MLLDNWKGQAGPWGLRVGREKPLSPIALGGA